MLADLAAASQPFAPLIGLAPLMRRAFLKEDLAPFGAALLARAQADDGDVNALLDFSTVLQLTGQRELALAVQAQAIAGASLYCLPARAPEPGLRLLVLMGPGDLMANTPVEFLVEEGDVTLLPLYLTLEGAWPDEVPEHDVALVAMAESDANQALLLRLTDYLEGWPRPVLNAPERIARLTRDGVYAALCDVPGLLAPPTLRMTRASLRALAAGEGDAAAAPPFPLIVRPTGSHAGQQLERLTEPSQLTAYLERTDAERFFVSRFVDYRSADGQFRKYRIVLIEGRPFICHFAISDHWMIHYLNAGMDDSADKRAEEAACMAGFDTQFAARHAQALRAIDARIGLPYLGIDCAETADGQLLIFEVDNAMIVHAMDAEPKYPYKKPAMRKVFDAFRQLLEHARHPASRS